MIDSQTRSQDWLDCHASVLFWWYVVRDAERRWNAQHSGYGSGFNSPRVIAHLMLRTYIKSISHFLTVNMQN